MNTILWRSSLRYLLRHPWMTLLSVVGVALGVAVVFSIDLVNTSAEKAFRLSTAAVTGRATHHVVGGQTGFADSVYSALRKDLGIRNSAPIVEGYVGFDAAPGRAFLLLGIDPFADPPFRPGLRNAGLFDPKSVAEFIAVPGTVYLSNDLAGRIGVSTGERVEIRTGAATSTVRVIGLIDVTEGPLRGLGDVVIADVSTAQEIAGMTNRLSRIDLIVPAENESKELGKIRAALPAGVELIRSESRSERIGQMTVAFRQNLFALSLLALVVGMFLIYNTMTFSVVRRREFIGDLRTLGVTRGEIFGIVLSEAAVIGVLGTAAGLLAGAALARVLVGMVTQTINDLYYVVNVNHVESSLLTLAKSLALGIGATILSAALPAREATRTPPRSVQQRSAAESRIRTSIPRLTAAGVFLLAAGAFVLWLPIRQVLLTFAGLLPLIAGFAVLTPGVLVLAMTRIPGVITRRMGLLGRIAVRGIVSQLSRSSVAIAALAIAVGTTVGVTTMVDSFRLSVVDWLDATLDADIYISPPSLVASRNDTTLDPQFAERLSGIEGVVGTNVLRGMLIDTQHGVANLLALRLIPGGEKKFRFVEGNLETAWPAFEAGAAALVSEPYAYRHRVSVGDSVAMVAETGRLTLPIAGVYRDYQSDIGSVMIDLDVYRDNWRDDAVSGVGLFVEDPDSIDAVIARVDGLLDSNDEVLVRSQRELRETSIEIFDRTFAITYVLRTLTVVVAFIGVLSALMALQLERSRELGVLRAIGLTPRQLWRLVTFQTGLMGFVAGLISLPFGMTLAVILIFVINKRSFGWTLEMHLGPEVFFQAMVVAVAAALLAGLYPGFKMARTSPARALREE